MIARSIHIQGVAPSFHTLPVHFVHISSAHACFHLAIEIILIHERVRVIQISRQIKKKGPYGQLTLLVKFGLGPNVHTKVISQLPTKKKKENGTEENIN